MSSASFDLLVVGAGIVGLAHALAAARRGWRVAVVERDARCVGASVRNFGFVTVSGQSTQAWPRARRSREVWAEVAADAGISIEQRGAWIAAQRPSAVAVLEGFARSAMGEGCRLLEADEARRQLPALAPGVRAVLHSPHELRVESRLALPRLAAWLQQALGVSFFWGEEVLDIAPPQVRTAQRRLQAGRVVVCPGTALSGVAAPWLAPHSLRLTRLQMLRLQPEPGLRLPAALLGDLSLVRYGGFAGLPEAAALRAELAQQRPACLAHGVHVIAVQSADGSLVVGDSHHDDDAAGPFDGSGLPAATAWPGSEAIDDLILAELRQLLSLPQCQVLERWIGHYPVPGPVAGPVSRQTSAHPGGEVLVQVVDPALRVVVVTSGTGASTGFAIAEEVLADW